jgi:hypothetical protein
VRTGLAFAASSAGSRPKLGFDASLGLGEGEASEDALVSVGEMAVGDPISLKLSFLLATGANSMGSAPRLAPSQVEETARKLSKCLFTRLKVLDGLLRRGCPVDALSGLDFGLCFENQFHAALNFSRRSSAPR